MDNLGEAVVVIRGFDFQRVEAAVGLGWSGDHGEKHRSEQLTPYVNERDAGGVLLELISGDAKIGRGWKIEVDPSTFSKIIRVRQGYRESVQ